MRKPSTVTVLSLLLASVWIVFFASNQPRAQDVTKHPIQKWQYTTVTEQDHLTSLGNEGWEAYAVTHNPSISEVRIYLKRPKN